MRWLSMRVIRLLGWEFEGSLPGHPKMVVIGAPHTSNWDFFLFLAALAHEDVDVRFLAAEGLFVGPVGWFLRRIGGIAVDQQGSQEVVRTVAESFDEAEAMILAVAPEGTRSAASHWRSGFWRIADAAGVPVAMVSVDGATKRIIFGPAHRIEGDPHAWMDRARSFYDGVGGLRPENAGAVRLASEIPRPRPDVV